ncbi:MAG: methyltransferase domain-containing protein [Saprospiraceae bacterium]|nr:methyltransferase domain-containing protein [Saprospiraceae bacterium]
MQQTPLYQRLDFLRESIRNLRLTGSVAPSSRFLCRAIVAKINPEKASVVVELGPGDGVITRYILERLRPDSRLVIFEINEIFVEKIRATFDDPRLLVIHDSAEHMGRHFKALNVEKVDYIVSGIPFVVLPEPLTRRITLECRRWLRTEGRFIQFHYSPLLIHFYRRVFGNVDVELVPLNIPPAIIISCEKKE